jgi:hypothetical protein
VAMAQVLSQPAARAKYHRQALVEPCFAELRERQGLKRFHRRGLAAVRVEFRAPLYRLQPEKDRARSVARLDYLVVPLPGANFGAGFQRFAPRCPTPPVPFLPNPLYRQSLLRN